MAVPKLRFKDENGADYPEWKVGRLKDYGKAIGGYGFPEKYQGIIDNKIPFFKVSDMNTVGNEITMNIANNTISTETAKEIKVKPFLKKAIVFAKVGAAVYLERKRKAEPPFLVDNNMMIYQSDNIDFDYLYHWFSNQKISRYAQIGALPSYNAGDIHSVKISVPCLEEQQKIADFLTTFDKRITAQQNIIADMEETKKGLLQKIFSQEIRFKDDNGEDYPEWSENVLSNLLLFQNGINGDKEMFSQGVKCIGVTDILNDKPIVYDSIKAVADVDNKTLERYSVSYGDILFQRSSENVEDAGKSNVYLDKTAIAVFSGFVIRGKKMADFNPKCLNSILKSNIVRKQIKQKAQGAQHINVSQELLSGIVVYLPSLPEQNKIASFLSTYDKKIEAEKKILADLQEMKKGLLQQMFV